jgi:threonine dehydrogenase-like Zn-dependent dehydrogenase
MATPFHGLTARATVSPGDAVVIIGVGGLGIHAVQIARALSAMVVIAVDIDPIALERAQSLGATHAVDASAEDAVAAIHNITGGGADVALECVGTGATISQAIAALRAGGCAAVIGIGADPAALPPATLFARMELDVKGVYAYSQVEIETVARLLAAGRLDAGAAISATYPLVAINDALEHFRTRRGSPVRVVVCVESGEN